MEKEELKKKLLINEIFFFNLNWIKFLLINIWNWKKTKTTKKIQIFLNRIDLN